MGTVGVLLSSAEGPSNTVIVVGAGPAGSAAALALRRAGAEVVLLERARFPRDKVCGDVLLPSAREALAALGLPLEELRRKAVLCTGSRYVTPRGRQISGEFRDAAGRAEPWWMVKRVELDAWLARSAVAAGAQLREGAVVSKLWREAGRLRGVVLEGGAHVEGSLVIGADGAASVVARELDVFSQPPEHVCVASRAYARGVELEEPWLEVHTSARTLPGCAWLVPVGGGEASIGLGLLRSDQQRLGRTPRALFDELAAELPLLRERLARAEVGPFKGWALPGAAQRRPLAAEGVLLAGDAGAMVDPFTGHGIHHALSAGRLAGEVAARALARGDVSAAGLGDYAVRCRAAFLDEAISGQRLQRVHAAPRLVELGAAACGVHPGLRWLFLSLVGHAASRGELFNARGLLRALFTKGPSLA